MELRSWLCGGLLLAAACSSNEASEGNNDGGRASGGSQASGGSRASGGTGGSGGPETSDGPDGSAGPDASHSSGGKRASGGSSAGGSGGSQARDSGTDDGSAGTGDAGPEKAEYPTCIELLSCVADCPDNDDTCPDDCFAAGSMPAQDQLLALLNCMLDNACEDVDCIETFCGDEMTTCLDSNATGGGTPASGGELPAGNIPSELVGHWTRPGSTDLSDFTFNADGSAAHSNYRETTLGSCDMAVHTQWNDGTVVANGDTLTVTLAEGTTSVAWSGGCGTGYTNPAQGQVLNYTYRIETGATPGIWLTDLDCSGDYCEEFYHKD